MDGREEKGVDVMLEMARSVRTHTKDFAKMERDIQEIIAVLSSIPSLHTQSKRTPLTLICQKKMHARTTSQCDFYRERERKSAIHAIANMLQRKSYSSTRVYSGVYNTPVVRSG